MRSNGSAIPKSIAALGEAGRAYVEKRYAWVPVRERFRQAVTALAA